MATLPCQRRSIKPDVSGATPGSCPRSSGPVPSPGAELQRWLVAGRVGPLIGGLIDRVPPDCSTPCLRPFERRHRSRSSPLKVMIVAGFGAQLPGGVSSGLCRWSSAKKSRHRREPTGIQCRATTSARSHAFIGSRSRVPNKLARPRQFSGVLHVLRNTWGVCAPPVGHQPVGSLGAAQVLSPRQSRQCPP